MTKGLVYELTMERRAARFANPFQRSHIHRGGGADAGAGNRGQHSDLQRCQFSPFAAAWRPRPRPAGVVLGYSAAAAGRAPFSSRLSRLPITERVIRGY